jgi:hypothetical protein
MKPFYTFMQRYLEKYSTVEKMRPGEIWTVVKIREPFPCISLIKKLENDCKQYFNRGIIIAYDDRQWEMLLYWQEHGTSFLTCDYDIATNRINYTATIRGIIHRS